MRTNTDALQHHTSELSYKWITTLCCWCLSATRYLPYSYMEPTHDLPLQSDFDRRQSIM